jgi:SNF2 domain-containing protein
VNTLNFGPQAAADVTRLRETYGLTRCTLKPFDHQVIGIDRVFTHPVFALFDEMGAGKTLQTIVGAILLHLTGTVNQVIISAPAAVRGVWFDPDLGELRKHLWPDLDVSVEQYHAGKRRAWSLGNPTGKSLRFLVTNYEFIRMPKRLDPLLERATQQTLLVCDESSAIKNPKAEQTKAILQLRRACGRILLLNGTPIANNPLDMYAQGLVMDPRILECKSYFHFRAKYAVMGGFQQRQVIAWQNLEDMQKRFAPYVLRRLKTDCLDLPPKLPPVTLSVALTDKTWKTYRDMRDEMVAWLSAEKIAVASQAVVKGMRLAQLTSGFLGGIQQVEASLAEVMRDSGLEEETDDRPSFIPRVRNDAGQFELPHIPVVPDAERQAIVYLPPEEIGREKLDFFLDWIAERLEADKKLKLLAWCRFRPELARVVAGLEERFPQVHVGAIWGGQTQDRYRTIAGQQVLIKEGERGRALRLLDPRTSPDAPVIVVGTPSTGSMGLNLTAANVVIYLSNDFSLKTRLQSEDRVHRPGQTRGVSYFDLVATGPAGQKTVDHLVIKSLREKNDIATWTTQAWRAALLEE